MARTFKELSIGQSFDFIKNGCGFNSFFLRCVKTSTRGYRDELGTQHRVGSIHASVYHVGSEPAEDAEADRYTKSLYA